MKQDEYTSKVTELQEDVKPTEIRYIPSGATPLPSILLMILLSLVVAGVCYAVARPICLLFHESAGSSGGGDSVRQFTEKRNIGLGMIFVNVVIFFVISLITVYSFKYLAYLTKLRNPKTGQYFAFFSAFVVCSALYLPLFDGRSLAPTDIAILFIPVSWVLMIAGCLAIPYSVSFDVFSHLSQMKFCEKNGKFLKKVVCTTLSWYQGKCLVQALRDSQYDVLPELFNSDLQKPETPSMTFTLFGHPQAETAYIDIDAKFEAVIGNATNSRTTNWLVYHYQMSQDEAIKMVGFIPSVFRKLNL